MIGGTNATLRIDEPPCILSPRVIRSGSTERGMSVSASFFVAEDSSWKCLSTLTGVACCTIAPIRQRCRSIRS